MNPRLLKAVFVILLCLPPSLCPATPEARADEEAPVYSLGEVVVSGRTEGVQAT